MFSWEEAWRAPLYLVNNLKAVFSEENYVPPIVNWVGKHAYPKSNQLIIVSQWYNNNSSAICNL